MNGKKYLKWLFAVGCSVMGACIRGDSEIPTICEKQQTANITMQEVKNLFSGNPVQIQEEWIVEGYVISSDRDENIFGSLYIQDKLQNPSTGFQIKTDVFSSYLFYPVGRKILIRLKGLYLGKNHGGYTLGGAFKVFDKTSVGRLPALNTFQHLSVSCEEINPIIPRDISINDLTDTLINTRIRLNNVELIPEEMGTTFAETAKEKLLTLTDCKGSEVKIVNSGYSSFREDVFPKDHGSVTGVLLKDNKTYYLVINEAKDVNFSLPRCTRLPVEVTSDRVFFSELADPNNNSKARFIELFNAGENDIALDGWQIKRYTNNNTVSNTSIDLTGHLIRAGKTFTISPNAVEFELVFGFSPDLSVSAGGPADSNGDDNLELVDPFGKVIDVFGVPGEDGSGTNHEFEDGRANRKTNVNKGNSMYVFSEWDVWNDSGMEGTIKMPKNAPDNFTPGKR